MCPLQTLQARRERAALRSKAIPDKGGRPQAVGCKWVSASQADQTASAHWVSVYQDASFLQTIRKVLRHFHMLTKSV